MTIKKSTGPARLLTALALAAASLTATTAHAASLTIQPEELASKDTFLYSYLTLWNFDTYGGGFGSAYGDILAVGKTTSASHDLKSLLQFSLSAASGLTSSDVTSASIQLYVISSSGVGFGVDPSSTAPIDVNLFKVTSSWSEGLVSWSSAPSIATPAANTQTISSIGYWVSFDATALVKGWLDTPSSNYGVLLEQNAIVVNGSDNVYGVFDSSYTATNGNEPRLIINY
jgi:hypothetical protein